MAKFLMVTSIGGKIGINFDRVVRIEPGTGADANKSILYFGDTTPGALTQLLVEEQFAGLMSKLY